MIRRSTHRKAVAIPVPLLTDERLSFRARGLAAYLLSKSDSWRIDARSLARSAPEGRDAVLTALGELRELGYLVTRRGQTEEGRWWTESVLYEDPADAATDSENPQGSPQPGDEPTGVGFPGPGSPDPGESGRNPCQREVKPPTPTGFADGDPPSSSDHEGQHRNCRACKTNPRGERPPNPEAVAAEARRLAIAASVVVPQPRPADAIPPAELAAAARKARAILRGGPPAESPPTELAS